MNEHLNTSVRCTCIDVPLSVRCTCIDIFVDCVENVNIVLFIVVTLFVAVITLLSLQLPHPPHPTHLHDTFIAAIISMIL